MRKIVLLALAATFGLLVGTSGAEANWGTLHYGGHQPKWAFWTRHHKKHCCEEERWQQFWHDYYDALQHYYDRLDNIDWVTYYKYHGYQINAGGPGCGPMGCNPYYHPQYAPVFVSPTIQWAVPHGGMGAAPCGPGGP
jgi:hypothetical protein